VHRALDALQLIWPPEDGWLLVTLPGSGSRFGDGQHRRLKGLDIRDAPAEPQRIVGAQRDQERKNVACRDRELGDGTRCRDLPDFGVCLVGEPQIAVEAGDDRFEVAAPAGERELGKGAGRRDPPIFAPVNSVNQRLPSGPAVMPKGLLLAVGTVNSVTVPLVVIRPILLLLSSVNHNFPSGPVAMLTGSLLAVRPVNSVTVPLVVICPILFARAGAAGLARWSSRRGRGFQRCRQRERTPSMAHQKPAFGPRLHRAWRTRIRRCLKRGQWRLSALCCRRRSARLKGIIHADRAVRQRQLNDQQLTFTIDRGRHHSAAGRCR
jgi:hypothetical protein